MEATAKPVLRTGIKHVGVSYNHWLFCLLENNTANMPAQTSLAKPFGLFLSKFLALKLHRPVHCY